MRGSFGEEGQKRETLLAPKTPPTYAGRLRLTAQEKEPGLDVCCCGALRERFSAQRAVGVDLAVHDHGDVGAVFQKLHDVFFLLVPWPPSAILWRDFVRGRGGFVRQMQNRLA